MVIIPVEWFNNKVGIFEVLQTFKSNVKVITELRVNGEQVKNVLKSNKGKPLTFARRKWFTELGDSVLFVINALRRFSTH